MSPRRTSSEQPLPYTHGLPFSKELSRDEFPYPSILKRLLALTFLLLLISSAATFASSWARGVIRGDNVTLNYPDLLSEASARRLLAERERALVYVMELLDSPRMGRVIVTITPSLVNWTAQTHPTDYGAHIEFFLPVTSLEAYERGGPSPTADFGCHEEVHAIVEQLWAHPEAPTPYSVPMALVGGIAVYINSTYQDSTGYALHASSLRQTGNLPDLLALLGDDEVLYNDPHGANIAHNGGATFVEYLVDLGGYELVASLYGCEWTRFGDDYELIPQDPEAIVLNVLGQSIQTVHEDWTTWSHRLPSIDPDIARLLIDTQEAYDKLVDVDRMIELMAVWNEAALRLIGPSFQVSRIIHQALSLNDRMFQLSTISELETAFLYQLGVAWELNRIAQHWLEAIAAYESFLDINQPNTPVADKIEQLEKALDGYAEVGDTHMVSRVQEWLAQFREGETESGS